MASDDDYWRSRYAQDDRQWRFERAREQARELYEANRRGHYDRARWIAGVPPADAGSDSSDSSDAPERTDPPTAGEQFREHKQDLLFNLRWAEDFLPQALLENWAMRVERLDIEEDIAGLAAIEAIREEYQQAACRYEPHITQASRQMDWNYYVPRIGHEIDWMIKLFRHVLTFR